MLSVQNLSKSFQGHPVVKDVSFELMPHKITALIGPNGAGKTTILSMLARILTPTEGSIIMNSQSINLADIGFLPQYPKFFEALTAREFLVMCGQLNGMKQQQIEQRADEVLQFVGLYQVMHKKTSTFSGGMKQRLGIAQAIFHKPKLLLLDEPVSALDPVGRREMMELLKALQQETTILYSTHILNDAEQMTDQVLFLKDGVLVEAGSLNAAKEKYAEDVYVVELMTEQQVQQVLTEAPFLFKQQNLTLTLPVTEVPMRELLVFLSSLPFDVVKVEKQTASLEEIFMKVAGK